MEKIMHIHESLPGQGVPKIIGRIWKCKCLVFYETQEYTPETKQSAIDLINAKIKLFKDENKGMFNSYKTMPIKSSKHGVVGVFRYSGTEKCYPSYCANIKKKPLKIEICYSIKYFGEDLALDLAVRMSKTLRICINHEHLMEELNEYLAYKKKLRQFRRPERIKKAVSNIVEAYEELEKYCIDFKGGLCQYENN
jgi:hypothetical protein